MRMARERFATALVVLSLGALGSLVVHQLSYALVRNPGNGHGHLSTQWAIIGPLAVMFGVATVLRQARNLGVRCPTTGVRLGFVSGAMFVAQEMIEAAMAGTPVVGALLSAATIAGVLIAPIVGLAIAVMLKRVAEAAARKPHVRRLAAGPAALVFSVANVVLVGRMLGCAAVPRGPPKSLLA